MKNVLKCGTASYRNAAFTVAIIDIILASLVLLLFVLGSSLMVAFEFSGNPENATLVLDEMNEDIFDTFGPAYTVKHLSNKAEDMGLFLMLMFLVIADFVISCLFFLGVKKWDDTKCQTWFNIRIIVFLQLEIVIAINLIYGTSWYRCIPDVIFTVYRIIDILVGYAFLKELREVGNVCQLCKKGKPNPDLDQTSIIQLREKRKQLRKTLLEMPIVTLTGPEEVGAGTEVLVSSFNSPPSIYGTRKNSPFPHSMVSAEYKI